MRDLRAIAEAATAGPWGEPVGMPWTEADAAHLAAWSPERAIAALDAIDALRSTLDAMAGDPCDCAAHRNPPELIRTALDHWDALA